MSLAPPIRIEALLRELAPEVLAAVMRRLRDFGAAEDAVQEALAAAATQWPREGVPDDPRAWLIHVAARRVTDHLRSEAARRKREELVVALISPEDQLALGPDEDASDGDDALLLLFMCCHPALTPASAIALTLRAVGGLTTREIASAFLVPESTMAQRISRAKETIRASGAVFERPLPADTAARLGAVLHVLYLVFSEGYAASSGDQVHRVDLSGEAIRITRLLRERLPERSEVTGLLALMLLTDARRAARTGPAGELVPLDAQDRSLWDRVAIEEGVSLAEQAISSGPVGSYSLQAAIAALHDEARSTDATDWPQVMALYRLLASLDDNPMVTLNLAIAIAMVDGPAAGLALLAEIEGDPRIASSHRLDAVRGHLHERAGAIDRAVTHYLRAAERTASVPERNYLLMRAARLREILEG